MSAFPEDRPPLVAIVGRPNVGKSTLFNRLLGDRRAIVEETAGVTRDRLVAPLRLEDPPLACEIMDTGGIGIVDRHDLGEAVEYQVLTGVHDAGLVLFLVDAREGLTPLDEEVARLLRRHAREILLVANKAESRAAQSSLAEFTRLGFGEPLALSAQEGLGVSDLLLELAGRLPTPPAPGGVAADALRIAVVGRRNTGKSSYVNALLGEQRVLVSEIPGTTRDAVEVAFRWRDRPLVLVDTAGIHRRSRLDTAVEYFSLTRSDQAIRRADVALLFLDLEADISRLDQELARTIHDRHKPVVVVGTKADLGDPGATAFRGLVEHRLPHLRGAPLCRISSRTGRGLDRTLELAFALHEEASRRVGTGELNRVMAAAFSVLRFRGRGEKPRVYYATQLRVAPPTFLLFVNRKTLFSREALRAIEAQLRTRLDFRRVPVRLVLRERERSPSKRTGRT